MLPITIFGKDILTMSTAVIYARVSSAGERQSTSRQVADLTDYANRNGFEVVEVYEEHISGAKRNEERAVLTECIAYAVGNKVDVVLFSELSRCGRAVWEVLDTIRTLKDNGINAYFQKEGLSLFSADGKENPYLAVMVSVLGVCSQIERESLLFRLNSGKSQFVANGGRLGRKVGSVKSKERKQEEYSKVIRSLKQGKSIRDTAVLCDVSVSTVFRVKREFGL
jgi:DNA invertase Pin-like site-specific DNA recombinase